MKGSQPPSEQATPETRQAVLSAMAHYIDLVRAVSSDSVAAVYAEDRELFESGMAPLYVARWRLEPDGAWKLSPMMMQPAPSAARESP